MKLRRSPWLGALAAVFASLALAGCGGGGGGGDSGNTGGGGGEVAIEGVATPNSVSVVTAKNAD
jgi:hypothetical protein